MVEGNAAMPWNWKWAKPRSENRHISEKKIASFLRTQDERKSFSCVEGYQHVSGLEDEHVGLKLHYTGATRILLTTVGSCEVSFGMILP